MTTEHTPGPWVQVPNTRHVIAGRADSSTSWEGWPVADAKGRTRAEQRANARLIAQAPFLLGIARMVALLGPGDPGVEALKERARDIIAEVEGAKA